MPKRPVKENDSPPQSPPLPLPTAKPYCPSYECGSEMKMVKIDFFDEKIQKKPRKYM